MVLKETLMEDGSGVGGNTVDLSEVMTFKQLAEIVNKPEEKIKNRKNGRYQRDE